MDGHQLCANLALLSRKLLNFLNFIQRENCIKMSIVFYQYFWSICWQRLKNSFLVKIVSSFIEIEWLLIVSCLFVAESLNFDGRESLWLKNWFEFCSYWEMKNFNFFLQVVLLLVMNLLHCLSPILSKSIWKAKSITNKKNQNFE